MGVVVDSNVPTGTIHDYSGGAIPPGYLLCDGSAISRVTYAQLFLAIRCTWGTGAPPAPAQNTIVTVADVAGSLQSLYFELYDQNGLVIPWLNLSGGGTPPTVPGANRYIMVTGTIGDSANQIATDIQTALAADSQFTNSIVSTNTVTAINTQNGPLTAGNAGDSGFTVNQTVTGTFGTFNIPDLRGKFTRCIDPTNSYDPGDRSQFVAGTYTAVGDTQYPTNPNILVNFDTTNVGVGQQITGPNIPTSYVTAIIDATTIEINNNATAPATSQTFTLTSSAAAVNNIGTYQGQAMQQHYHYYGSFSQRAGGGFGVDQGANFGTTWITDTMYGASASSETRPYNQSVNKIIKY